MFRIHLGVVFVRIVWIVFFLMVTFVVILVVIAFVLVTMVTAFWVRAAFVFRLFAAMWSMQRRSLGVR